MQPAIFLDRDGVIIANRANYVRSWAEVEIFPQALEALAYIQPLPYAVVIVTNQSGVGRGLIPTEIAEEINMRLVERIEAAGGHINAVYMCPHAPQDACSCRKPKPGLLFQAAEDLDIDLNRSILIGDALTDLEAGQAAGVSQNVLLRTGRGAEQARARKAKALAPFLIFDCLYEALKALFPAKAF